MIIECINCNKKFNVVSDLIPAEGRLVQCGSCDHSWHYKIEKPSSKPLILDEIDNLKNKIKEKTQDDNSNNKDNDDPKKITKQDPPTAGFVEWHDRSQEIKDRMAARQVALTKEFKKKK